MPFQEITEFPRRYSVGIKKYAAVEVVGYRPFVVSIGSRRAIGHECKPTERACNSQTRPFEKLSSVHFAKIASKWAQSIENWPVFQPKWLFFLADFKIPAGEKPVVAFSMPLSGVDFVNQNPFKLYREFGRVTLGQFCD